ncbi:hypothetical protein KIPB_002194 [Kipferlia bialata]|uniref:P-type ATPase C-terminal domain-containing protein n=1 Tax=Kipferlia bialata TaxID=797122 RepID=A0A9K3CRV8_9EUKA|nr:hypothetical protein KIPB_002194 [Kipferlia bialata]|eukprot:g2194.t1
MNASPSLYRDRRRVNPLLLEYRKYQSSLSDFVQKHRIGVAKLGKWLFDSPDDVFSFSTICFWMIRAVLHTIIAKAVLHTIVMLFLSVALSERWIGQDGNPADMRQLGFLYTSAVMVVQLVTQLHDFHVADFFVWAAVLGCFLLFPVSSYVLGASSMAVSMPQLTGVAMRCFMDPVYWLSLAGVVAAAYAPVALCKSVAQIIWPRESDRMRARANGPRVRPLSTKADMHTPEHHVSDPGSIRHRVVTVVGVTNRSENRASVKQDAPVF